MEEMEEKCDLCLCLGTSLSGMNADRMASTPAENFLSGVGCGTVIINLQMTPLDKTAGCTVRIWAKIDEALKILVKELDLGKIEPRPVKLPHGDIFYVNYNAMGFRDESVRMRLDLSQNAKVKIAHIQAVNYSKKGRVEGKDQFGNYVVYVGHRRRYAYLLLRTVCMIILTKIYRGCVRKASK